MNTTKKEIILDLEVKELTSKASKIFNYYHWQGLWSLQEFRRFCKNIKKTAKREGLYEAQEMFLNLTR